jgi:hypothetical protein
MSTIHIVSMFVKLFPLNTVPLAKYVCSLIYHQKQQHRTTDFTTWWTHVDSLCRHTAAGASCSSAISLKMVGLLETCVNVGVRRAAPMDFIASWRTYNKHEHCHGNRCGYGAVFSVTARHKLTINYPETLTYTTD